MITLYNSNHKEFRNRLLSKSNLEKLFINVQSLYFPHWPLWLVCAPQFNSGQYVRRWCPSLVFAHRLTPVSGSEFLWNILEKHVFIMLRLLFCRKSWLLQPIRSQINECSVDSDYGLWAENTSLTLYSLPSSMIDQLVLFRV